MKKIKVLHFITELALGGAQKSTVSTLKYLNSERYSKYLVAARPQDRNNSWLAEASNIKNLEIILLPDLQREMNLFKDIKIFFQLRKILSERKIDIIHTHSSKAGIIGRWAAFFAGVKGIIHTIHGFSFNDYQAKPFRLFYIFLERMTAKITDRLIAVAESDIKKGREYKVGNREQYVLIRDVIELAPFFHDEKIHEIKRELGIRQDDNIVGMVACFKKQKKVDDFLRAIQKVKEQVNVKGILIGDGFLRSKLEILALDLNLEKDIIFLGWRKDVYRIAKVLDIIVLSSLWEGLPLVLLEGMATKKPVIATAVNGVSEVIKDGENGYLIEPGDYNSLAEKIIFLLKNRQFSKEMGRKGFSFISENQEFKREQTVNKIENLYDEFFSE